MNKKLIALVALSFLIFLVILALLINAYSYRNNYDKFFTKETIKISKSNLKFYFSHYFSTHGKPGVNCSKEEKDLMRKKLINLSRDVITNYFNIDQDKNYYYGNLGSASRGHDFGYDFILKDLTLKDCKNDKVKKQISNKILQVSQLIKDDKELKNDFLMCVNSVSCIDNISKGLINLCDDYLIKREDFIKNYKDKDDENYKTFQRFDSSFVQTMEKFGISLFLQEKILNVYNRSIFSSSLIVEAVKDLFKSQNRLSPQ